MAKLTRKTAKIFGETATATGNDPEIGQFGSAKLGTYVGTGDIDTIQGLAAWSNGWVDAVTPIQQFPTLPEMTGVHKVLSYQNAYLLQQGVAEWDSATTYYTNNFCAYNGTIYKSLADNNLNQNPSTATAYWASYGTSTGGNYADQDLSNLTTTGNNKILPSQSGNHNKFLTTNGTSPSWIAVDYANQYLNNLNATGERRVLPSQSGNSGKYLTTNGTSPYWTVAPFPNVNYSAKINITAQAFLESGTGYRPSSSGVIVSYGRNINNSYCYLYVYNTSGTELFSTKINHSYQNVCSGSSICIPVNSSFSYRIWGYKSAAGSSGGEADINFFPYY